MKISDQLFERSCGAIVFRLFGGCLQVLMVRHYAGHWSFPKGHVEAHETDEETAVREVFEETGINIAILSDFVEESTYEPRRGIEKTVRFFIGDYVGGELLPQQEEVSSAEWFTPEEALDLLTFDRDREIFCSALLHIGFAVACDAEDEADSVSSSAPSSSLSGSEVVAVGQDTSATSAALERSHDSRQDAPAFPQLRPCDRKARDDTFTLKSHYTVEELLRIMRFLRSDEGCPWDREQTHESIAGNMLEEAYETVDAITSGNKEDLCEELGDVLMQVVFHSSMAEDEGHFDFDDVVSGICRKLISRHSHLFGDDHAKTPEEVLTIWNKNKDREKGFDSVRESMEAVSRGLPALTRSLNLQKRAARVGFDWPDARGALNKIKEEYGELLEALAVRRDIVATEANQHASGNKISEMTKSQSILQKNPNENEFRFTLPAMHVQSEEDDIQQVDVEEATRTAKNPADDSDSSQFLYSAKRRAVEEAGDLLFAVVNALRLSGIDPETALTMSSEKFIRRFSEVERLALSEGRKLESMTLDEMDVLWKRVKAEE